MTRLFPSCHMPAYLIFLHQTTLTISDKQYRLWSSRFRNFLPLPVASPATLTYSGLSQTQSEIPTEFNFYDKKTRTLAQQPTGIRYAVWSSAGSENLVWTRHVPALFFSMRQITTSVDKALLNNFEWLSPIYPQINKSLLFTLGTFKLLSLEETLTVVTVFRTESSKVHISLRPFWLWNYCNDNYWKYSKYRSCRKKSRLLLSIGGLLQFYIGVLWVLHEPHQDWIQMFP